MMIYLKAGVILSFFISIISLFTLVLKTKKFGKRKFYSEPQGNTTRGIIYAFTKGMAPWEKESAIKHLPSYMAGILYHSGVFTSFTYLLITLIPLPLPKIAQIPLQLTLLVGFLCGILLLFKRIIAAPMRAISCIDDFVSNIIVDLFILFALLHTFYPGLLPLFFLISIIMFLYMPMGKIRHCVFFFYTRILFGYFYGRRGVVPHKKQVRFER